MLCKFYCIRPLLISPLFHLPSHWLYFFLVANYLRYSFKKHLLYVCTAPDAVTLLQIQKDSETPSVLVFRGLLIGRWLLSATGSLHGLSSLSMKAPLLPYPLEMSLPHSQNSLHFSFATFVAMAIK